MQRRDIIKLLSLVLVNSNAMTKAEKQRRRAVEKRNQRVIVIGAGLAGLGAARELKRCGYEVIVLEARDRIGGRIWTSRKWPDVPLDMGASWIHGTRGNPMTALADEIGAKRWITSYAKNVTYDSAGKLLDDAGDARLENLAEKLRALVVKAQNQENDISVRESLSALLADNQESAEQRELIHYVLSSEIEHEYAGSAAQLSSHWYDSAHKFDGDEAIFAQGYDQIVEHLAADLKIDLGQVVVKIDWSEPEIRVRTEKADHLTDQVVVTLPLGVLQKQQSLFSPDLPAEKRAVISKLGMGILNKCYLRFNEAFWPDDVDWLGYISAKHGEWNEWVSFKRVAQLPILLGFNAADRGQEIEAWSNEKIAQSAMQTLRTIFGPQIPKPVDFQITRWGQDPFSHGSYSFNAVGTTPSMRDELAKPVAGKLFFAGEASHQEHFATAHGAYLSGLRAAEEICSERGLMNF
ncbi:MAG: FAD-dependent oxidoreductase [Verrucomicrobia bacterium]|nr:MAG: FAD-dependent oxidoreductase [Verrucomicrobiota bacterium]